MKTLKTIFPAALSQIRKGSTFLSIKNYRDNYDGHSNFGIVFHIDYIKAVKKSIEFWIGYEPKNDIERFQRKDLIESYTDTLNGRSRSKSAFSYTPISNGHEIIHSCKWHAGGNAIHIYGFVVHKVVLVPSLYPADNRSAWTKTRDELVQLTPLSRFRQFKIVDGRFDSIAVEHLTFTQKDLIRNIESES